MTCINCGGPTKDGERICKPCLDLSPIPVDQLATMLSVVDLFEGIRARKK